jgi:hypothetical protein
VLNQSDTNIETVSTLILNEGFDVAFLVPTETAMEKSIMDAHGSIRAFLKRNNIHDYEKQPQGPKEYIDVNFITSIESYERKVSLYRPETKDGDPRIWIYGLRKLAVPWNLIALIYSAGVLYVVNCSKKEDLTAALNNVIPKPVSLISSTASELLLKLKAISQRGMIPSMRQGDTGVGMTLETLLGIEANSNRAPDYHGIELKASRVNKGARRKNKNQLFSKTPSWKLSPIGSAENLVMTRGYVDQDDQYALRHTISGEKPNSLGLYLDIDYTNNYLRQMFTDTNSSDFNPKHDMTWLVDDLRKALQKKHNETFWVKALHNNDRNNESFHYVEVEHTSNPYIDKLETLLETGLITMDYTLHLKESGKARDHGYLFKLKANSIESLFPKPLSYDLTE